MFNDHTKTGDIVVVALRRAFQQGQTYWQQADSMSYVENRRSDLTYNKFCTLQEETVTAVSKQIEYMQSQIDSLMLEYCPDEMSREQLDNWAKNQQLVPDEYEVDIIRTEPMSEEELAYKRLGESYDECDGIKS